VRSAKLASPERIWLRRSRRGAEVEEAHGDVGARGGGDDAAVGVLPGGLVAGTLVLDEGGGAGAQGPAAWGWQRVRASGLRVNERRR